MRDIEIGDQHRHERNESATATTAFHVYVMYACMHVMLCMKKFRDGEKEKVAQVLCHVMYACMKCHVTFYVRERERGEERREVRGSVQKVLERRGEERE